MYTVPPLLLEGFNATIKNATDTLRLTCVFSADPLPMVEWYFQGEQQSEPVPINIGNGTDILLGPDEEEVDSLTEFVISSTVVISQVTVNNEGTYICNATNGVPNLIGSITSNNSTLKVQGT